MKKNNKKILIITTIILIFCFIMAIVDGVIKVNYFQKSIIKLFLFLGFPFVYSFFDKELEIKRIFRFNKSNLTQPVLLAVGVYGVIVGGYFLLRNVFDFSKITENLTGNIGVTKENFIFVSIYISFVNSLLEEFFFRGFSFLSLQRLTSKKFAYVFSAGMFSLYHIAMMIGWFSFGLFMLILFGLFAGGLIFNYLNDKSKSIYPSYFVHMAANFAINTVGFILFGN